MTNIKSFQNSVNKISDSSFDNHAIELFRYQSKNNHVYKQYLDSLNINPLTIKKVNQIPFLPIEFFKYHPVKTNEWEAQLVFESSGTTHQVRSKHYIQDVNYYHLQAKSIFEDSFGPLLGKTVVALLPSYLERGGSSLVSMVNSFIQVTESANSGFYLNEVDELVSLLNKSKDDEIYLFGVTFALYDLAQEYNLNLGHVTIIETGGMKGRKEEIIKDELYDLLEQNLGVNNIYSEYGMTELVSQVYGKRGKFSQINSMRILVRDVNDPYEIVAANKTGGINIIDLANVHSCAFIETKDLGRINADGSFEILGRFDNSDLRGCNLLVI